MIMLIATCVGFTGRAHAWKAKGSPKNVYHYRPTSWPFIHPCEHHSSSFFFFFLKTYKLNPIRGNDDYVNNSDNIID